MKILYVITGLGLGGAERVVVDLADKMSQLGYEVKIAYLTGKVIIEPKNKEIEIIFLGLYNILYLISAYNKLRNLIYRFKPDVVHSHMFHSNILTRLVRILSPIPKLINTVHSSSEGGALRMLTYRLTHRYTSVVTNVSKEASLKFEEKKAVPIQKMLTIYNGIDTNKYKFSEVSRTRIREELGLNSKDKFILAVGRFNIAKDYPNLLQAVAILKEKNFLFKLFIAGEGELKIYIEQLINQLDIKDYIILLGARNDVQDLMCGADVFVLSSAWEGFGLVVAEAMACERIVVATDCGGVREVLGETGILIPNKNSLKLAQALQESLAIEEKESRQKGFMARERVISNYSLDISTKKWLELYMSKI